MDFQRPDENRWQDALSDLRGLIMTSTTSMTSVPKPLKYLRNSYGVLKTAHSKINSEKKESLKKDFSDILSVLAMAGSPSGSRECLKYCLQGNMKNPGEWGHEYVRQLEAEIAEEWALIPLSEEDVIRKRLIPLVKKILNFDMKHNAEIQACDLCLEIDQLHLMKEYLDRTNFKRVCSYLVSCASYSEEMERTLILETVVSDYLKFEEYSQAMLVALQLGDDEIVTTCLEKCQDSTVRKQLAFILARQQGRPLKRVYEGEDAKEIELILSNVHVNGHFQILVRELDILEAKSPDEIYKSWLEAGSGLRSLVTDIRDSARANLAASFSSAFVHAGFGADKLMSNTEDCWVYKNKDHGMFSATASLGFIHLWDVDGGLVPIDKFLYTSEDFIKSGALLAIGIVNCGVRNECDPALALLTDYLCDNSQTLRIGSTLGLGLAYVGSRRSDVSELLIAPLSDRISNMEVVSIAAISLGLVNVGSGDAEVSTAILQKLLELTPLQLSTPYFNFLPLALGLVYMGRRDMIEAVSAALEVLPDPHKVSAQTMLQIGRYGSPPGRRAVPLSLALSSLSNPDPIVVDVLNKYSHDSDADVAFNAIFGLGLVGAGTNNARLATMLRQLAAYHAKNPLHLFLTRVSQGLVHLGKGTLTLCPLRYGSKILDQSALAGLMIVLIAFLDCRNLILSRSHYLMYCLATAMQPRWLVTLDTDLKPLPVSVRVGQAVDILGKAGSPKSIAGGHVHTTPVLLASGEKAELLQTGDQNFEPLSEILEGFVILKEKSSK
ncbi:26S proteasome non-ATPase regulatory subunit 2-like [Athalia rosae]|uniref:26S proteasome non-ATPase regulatory subunit 2-like n=1 Tax=Athalia rosae TaxID=37344 RepID=UPI0020337880|nr:26S proteasome non-ATPase regulatory subunit 2-like [Athalia rosae]